MKKPTLVIPISQTDIIENKKQYNQYCLDMLDYIIYNNPDIFNNLLACSQGENNYIENLIIKSLEKGGNK